MKFPIGTRRKGTEPPSSCISVGRGKKAAIHFLDSTTGKRRSSLLGQSGIARELAYSSDGNKLAVVLGSSVELWDVAKSTRLISIKTAPGQRVRACRFLKNNLEIMTLDEMGQVQVWSTTNGQLKRTILDPPEPTTDPAWRMIAIGGGVYLLAWLPLIGYVRRKKLIPQVESNTHWQALVVAALSVVCSQFMCFPLNPVAIRIHLFVLICWIGSLLTLLLLRLPFHWRSHLAAILVLGVGLLIHWHIWSSFIASV